MIKMNIFIIIFILFLLFISLQIYFYYHKYYQNQLMIQKMEQFQTQLVNIEANKEYTLDDSSIERLLDNYNNIQNNL